MSLNELRALLVRWARFVVLGNKGSMGFAASQYTEYIGKGSFHEYGLEPDPEVDDIDKSFKLLPGTLRTILWIHYVLPGNVSTKHEPGKGRAYHQKKLLAEEALISIHKERLAKEGRTLCASEVG